MPSRTARMTPANPTTTRSGWPGNRRTSVGPIQPPTRNPAASGATAAHRTLQAGSGADYGTYMRMYLKLADDGRD